MSPCWTAQDVIINNAWHDPQPKTEMLTSWYHFQASGLMGSPTVPRMRSEEREYFFTQSSPKDCSALMAVGAVYKRDTCPHHPSHQLNTDIVQCSHQWLQLAYYLLLAAKSTRWTSAYTLYLSTMSHARPASGCVGTPSNSTWVAPLIMGPARNMDRYEQESESLADISRDTFL